MKKLLSMLMIGALVALASCSKSDPAGEIEIPVPTITLPTHDAGSASATFTTTAAWTLSLTDTKAVPGWFTVDKTSGGAGTHTLTITIAEANPSSTEVRTGYIKIVSGDITQTITLTQPKAAVVAVTGVSLNKGETVVTVNKKETLTATIAPANASNKNITWSSSDQNVATVSSTGEITGVKAGIATITATTVDGKKTATCAVKVSNEVVAVTGVTLNKTTASLFVGESEALTATVNPANATNQSFTWSSSNIAVVTVSTSGVVIAKGVGSATITVTTMDGGKTATCTVTVQPIAVTGVTLDKSTAKLSFNKTGTLTPAITPANATDKRVTWSSSDPSIVSISNTGVTKGLAVGTATITVTTTDGSKTATCVITVVNDISTGVIVDSWGNTIDLGGGEAQK